MTEKIQGEMSREEADLGVSFCFFFFVTWALYFPVFPDRLSPLEPNCQAEVPIPGFCERPCPLKYTQGFSASLAFF